MIIEQILNKDVFLNRIQNLKYKDKDNKEVEHITSGSLHSVQELYKNMDNTRWAEYYLIKDTNNNIICSIILTFDNYLHYFVTNKLTTENAKKFIKTIKKLTKETLLSRPVLFVRTSTWYHEAMKFNRIIGFKCDYINYDYEYSIWFIERGMI